MTRLEGDDQTEVLSPWYGQLSSDSGHGGKPTLWQIVLDIVLCPSSRGSGFPSFKQVSLSVDILELVYHRIRAKRSFGWNIKSCRDV